MNDTQHTPGPWATDGREAGWNILGLAGERVATVWRDGPGQPANARLIAACPEMLVALIDLLSMIESPQISVSGVVGGQWEVTKKEARAAIAKATGQ